MAADPSPVVGRLAPSPTGAQHIGNASTFLIAWFSLRKSGGQIILRMEDIDSPRIKFGAAEQAIADLRWLGIDWDEGPDCGGPHAPYVQTERMPHYKEVLRSLQSNEQVYPCFCTRSDVAAAASAPHVGQEGPRYPGTCSSNRVQDASDSSAQGQSYSWRFRTKPGSASDQFDDLLLGQCQCNLHAELGDFVVFKNDGTPAYQLAVVADDHAMKVTEVIRGADLLPSTFRQRALYHHLDWTPPTFGHAPLIVGPDGRRLAKRHGDTRLATLREQGVRPERLIGWLAYTHGWIEQKEAISLSELLPHFSLATIKKGPQVFAPADLEWLFK